MTELAIKKGICQIGKRLYARNLVAGCDGNISVRLSNNEIWITPTGVSKGFMTPSMMVKVDIDGNVLEGSHSPTSEMQLHLEAFRNNPQINCVVHAHPPMATAFSVAGEDLAEPILIESVYGIGAIPLAKYGEPGSIELAKSVVPFVQSHRGCLLPFHGAVTWGRTLEDAINYMETLEQCSTVLYNVKVLNNNKINYVPGLKDKIGGRPC